MRILDAISDKALAYVCLYLTENEAASLSRALKDLLDNPKVHHCHINDADHSHEITVSIYRDGNMSRFDHRSQRLLAEDE